MDELIKNIINQGEKINTESKEAKEKLPKSLFETVCAFLNRFGGNIILGVNDMTIPEKPTSKNQKYIAK